MRWLKEILTADDNVTYDIGAVLCFSANTVVNCLTIINFFLFHIWSETGYATAISTINIAFGVHFYLKHGDPKDG
jgi:hypothetical protein